MGQGPDDIDLETERGTKHSLTSEEWWFTSATAGGSGAQGHSLLHRKSEDILDYMRSCLKMNKIKQTKQMYIG